jgi:DNA-binding MarR family transcriptional regulator
MHPNKLLYKRKSPRTRRNAPQRGMAALRVQHAFHLAPRDQFTAISAGKAKENDQMALSFRQNEILDIARTEGRVVVEDLAQRFDVTLQTIRRDLTELSDMGHLDRVHGGAVLRTGVVNLAYEQRRHMNDGAKAAIARACAAATTTGTTRDFP